MPNNLYQRMKKWKLTDAMILQFIDGLFKPHELRLVINHCLKRLKEMEDGGAQI